MDLHFAAQTSSDFVTHIFYLISNRDATSDPNAAGFCRFPIFRTRVADFIRLNLWLWVIFIDDWVTYSQRR